jgi:hypothetical protein
VQIDFPTVAACLCNFENCVHDSDDCKCK